MSKYITFNQIIEIIKTHIFTVCPIFIVGILIFAGVITNDVGSVIYSAVAVIIYFFAVYNKAYDTAKRDMKSFTPEQPYPLKGLLLPVGIIVLSIIIYILYFVSWRFMSIDGTIVRVSGWINNFLFIIWSFPYTGFMELKNGYMSLSGHLLLYIVPIVASFLGYFAGYKNYDITVTFSKFVFVKKNQDDKNEK